MRLLIRSIVAIFLLNLFLTPASYALAADLNWSANTTLSLSGVTFSTLTIASGSAATSLIVGTTTFTVTVPSGGTFTVNASSAITFANDGGVSTTCGATSSIAIAGPKTSLVVTPTNTACSQQRSSAATLILISPPIDSPTKAKAVATTSNVTLTWIDPTSNILDGINILRNKGGASDISGVVYAETVKGVQTFTDTNVVAGETYKYLVRARDTNGNMDENNNQLIVMVVKDVPLPEKIIEKVEEKKEEKVVEEAPTQGVAEVGVPTTKVGKVKKEDVVIPEEKEVQREEQRKITLVLTEEAKTIVTADTTTIARSAGKVADPAIEKAIREEEKFAAIIVRATGTQAVAAVGFIAYGTPTTATLGEGERAGVLDSYRKAYGDLPKTEDEWNDAMRIAGGQDPEQAKPEIETRSIALFKKIYKRAPVITHGEESTSVLVAQESDDRDAIAMLAYGIRPLERNLDAERRGIGVFQGTFGRIPKSASDWDTVRMVAYANVEPP